MISILKNKPVIINTDLDGILSGLLLKKVLNCNIVGFSNSNEIVWVKRDFLDFKNVCFIDLYVTNPDTISVEQHIIAYNQEHYNKLKANPNKINPNLLNPRFFLPNASYYKKYPFSTIQFIIALLEHEGFDLSFLELSNEVNNIKLLDFVLRADDTMKTTVNSPYIENAKNWWNWLINFSNEGNITQSCFQYLKKIDETESLKIKKCISQFLTQKPYLCNSSDGGIAQILDVNNKLKENVKTYFSLIAQLMKVEVFDLSSKYVTKKGYAKRFSLTNENAKELINFNSINHNKVFSYAFVRSSNRNENFSCTFYEKK